MSTQTVEQTEIDPVTGKGREATRSIGVRKQQPCACPWGWQNTRDYGRERVRLSTTTGCLEHDTCHHYDGTRDAWGVAKWCPIHEAKGCPNV